MHARTVEVLSVEDNPADRFLIQRYFDHEGTNCKLTFAKDGQEAVNYLHDNLKPLPHFILLDLNLPKVDGREILRIVKEDGDLMHIPVIVFTTSNSTDDILECYKLHANAFLVKPSDLEKFHKILNSVESFWALEVELYLN